MSTVKTVKYQVGTDGTSSNNFTIYQPDPPDGTMRIGVGNADNPTEIAQFTSSGLNASALTGTLPAIDGSALTNLPSLGAPDAIFTDVKSSGTDGGTFTTGAWRTRDLNTIDGAQTAASLNAGNSRMSFTAPGILYWSAPAYSVNNHQTRLYNVTDAVYVEPYGSVEFAIFGTANMTRSFGWAEVESGKTYEIRHRCEDTRSITGFGFSAGFGDEVYTIATFTRTS